MENTVSRKTSVALLSVVSNSALVLLKLLVGFVIGSISVISVAIHSAVDLVAALIAFFAVRKSGKPADEDHPFGHGKVENISGTVEAVLIFLAAGWIIFEAVKKLRYPEPLDEPGWGVLVMLVSAVVNTVVSQLFFKVGRETDSLALQADAWHLRTDVYTSAGVMVGLGLIWLGERAFPGVHFHWLNPMAAIGVALLIIKAAYDLTIKSARDLLDESLPAEALDLIRSHIREFAPEVRGFHRLRTRKSGSDRFVDFHSSWMQHVGEQVAPDLGSNHRKMLFQVVQAGAQGCAEKTIRPEELVQSIRDVSLGKPSLSSGIAWRVLRGLSGSDKSGETKDRLSERETQILRLMTQGKLDEEIAQELVLTEVTVRTHISRILKAGPGKPGPGRSLRSPLGIGVHL